MFGLEVISLDLRKDVDYLEDGLGLNIEIRKNRLMGYRLRM